METIAKNIPSDLRNTLLQYINEIPGIRYRELLRLTGFANGVLTYHLRLLEKSNSVKVDRKSRMTRYYPISIPSEESRIIGFLKTNTARKITVFILEHDSCTFNEIVEHVKKVPSTVSWHLKRLADAGMVSVHNGQYLLYTLRNRGAIVEILSKYEESFVDKVVNNYTEMMEEL